MLTEVTFKEIEAIFSITDALGLHREALVIPLRPRSPGHVRRLPTGKLEIVVDAQADFADWLAGLAEQIAAV